MEKKNQRKRYEMKLNEIPAIAKYRYQMKLNDKDLFKFGARRLFNKTK